MKGYAFTYSFLGTSFLWDAGDFAVRGGFLSNDGFLGGAFVYALFYIFGDLGVDSLGDLNAFCFVFSLASFSIV